jgi:uncharacterized membrane protein YphA (DoxX/SURF4 family)
MKNIILFVLCLLTGLLFINAGLDKFFHYMPTPKEIPEKMAKTVQAFNTIGWLMPLVGLMEVICGALLIFKRTRPLGALILIPLLTGILLTNINMAPQGLPTVLILIAIIGWVVVENKERFLPIIKADRL